MIVKEKLDDIKIEYWYSKDFKWIEPMTSEKYQGHPRPGLVYRVIVNDHTKNVKLLISDNDALVMNDFHGLYEGTLVPISAKNLLDLNLKESELDKIIAWQNEDNRSLKRYFEAPQPVSGEMAVMMTLAQAISEQEKREKKALKLATETLSELIELDPLAFGLIMELAECVINEPQTASSQLATDPQFSTGINISRVFNSLTKYIGDDRKTNFDRDDLIEAFLGIMNELKAIEQEE